ncbi:MAG: FAD-dependent oxidoreductase [Mariprofundus sp.]
MSECYDMSVLGAGISGLAMAFEAEQAGMRVLVLEKADRAGGCMQSRQVDDGDHPFWLEMGTHTCFNSYGRLLKLLSQLGLMENMQAREKLPYRLLVADKLVSIPSRLHFFELATHAWKLFSLKKQGQSVKTYYSAIVGEKNYHEVFQHAFNAVLCQPASDVPADMLFRKRPRNKNVMRSYTFPKGLEDIITALEARLNVKKGQSIQHIDYGPDGYSIKTADTGYLTDKLVCATPVLAAARLLKDAHPDIAGQLEWVGEVEIESVGAVVEKDAMSVERIAGLIAADGDFYSAVSRDIVDHPHLRAITFHFKPGLLSDEQKNERICKLLTIAPSDLLHSFHHTNRLPAPDIGHHDLIAELNSTLSGKPLALVGNYFSGVAVEDCLERVESEFTRLRSAT